MKTLKIKKQKCKKCHRFRAGYCPLEDLQPCSFIPKKRDSLLKTLLLRTDN